MAFLYSSSLFPPPLQLPFILLSSFSPFLLALLLSLFPKPFRKAFEVYLSQSSIPKIRSKTIKYALSSGEFLMQILRSQNGVSFSFSYSRFLLRIRSRSVGILLYSFSIYSEPFLLLKFLTFYICLFINFPYPIILLSRCLFVCLSVALSLSRLFSLQD